jgi:hypothetical protein
MKKSLKCRDADNHIRVFRAGQKVDAINCVGDVFPATIQDVHPQEEKLNLHFDDGSSGKWPAGAVSKERLPS